MLSLLGESLGRNPRFGVNYDSFTEKGRQPEFLGFITDYREPWRSGPFLHSPGGNNLLAEAGGRGGRECAPEQNCRAPVMFLGGSLSHFRWHVRKVGVPGESDLVTSA